MSAAQTPTAPQAPSDRDDHDPRSQRLWDAGLLVADGDGAVTVPASVVEALTSATTAWAVRTEAEERAWLSRLGLDAEQVEHAVTQWVTPLRLAASERVRAVEDEPRAVLAGAESLTRARLRPRFAEVVAAAQGDHDDGQAPVVGESLLALLCAAGAAREVEDGAVVELTPAFERARRHHQRAAVRRKATERRHELGELLGLDDEDLSTAFRAVGDGPSLGELAALHRFTGATSLPLWQLARTLDGFRQGWQRLEGHEVEAWLGGRTALLFTSSYARPARVLEELLGQALRGLDLPVAAVDADEERAACERFGVDRPPALLLMEGHQERARLRFASTPITLREQLERFLAGEPVVPSNA